MNTKINPKSKLDHKTKINKKMKIAILIISITLLLILGVTIAIIFYFYLFRKFFSVFTTNCNTVKQITRQAGTVTSKSLMDTPKIRLIA